jgi:hypothetical protein
MSNDVMAVLDRARVLNGVTDQATATAALNKVRDDLVKAAENAASATTALRDGIVRIRPSGLLTVDQMAEAIERDRNYVDSVWSNYGDTHQGKQTRVPALAADDENVYELPTYRELADLARNQRGTAATLGVIRAERDRIVAMIYASKLLGPSAIGSNVGVDRNHVLRIARKANVQPVHRTDARNQYTTGKRGRRSAS